VTATQPVGRAQVTGRIVLPIIIAAWLIPGAGHVLHGDVRRGGILFVTLTAMFALGIAFGGRLFPFQLSEWLVFLAAVAQWGAGVPRLIAGLAGVGDGDVIAVTYEYGNTFLMASGLLNALVVLDVYDRARGLKGAGIR
jgi:hypothetical protein